MNPMNASDSCLVLPLPRDTKDIGDLSDTIAYSGSMIRCYIELLRLFCFRQFSCTNKSRYGFVDTIWKGGSQMPHEDEDRCVHGTCVWFNDERGYGFLLSDGGVSSMVHYTNIKEPGFKRLYRGQRVVYEELDTEKGKSAHRVKYEKDFTYIADHRDDLAA